MSIIKQRLVRVVGGILLVSVLSSAALAADDAAIAEGKRLFEQSCKVWGANSYLTRIPEITEAVVPQSAATILPQCELLSNVT